MYLRADGIRVHVSVSNENIFIIQATVAYYLMLDNRRRLSNGYLGSEFDEGKVSVRLSIIALDIYSFLRENV